MTTTSLGSYVLGLAGLGLLRRWYDEDAADHRNRLVEIAGQYDASDILQFSFATPELDVETGYTQWSEKYDGPGNSMIDAEESVMKPRIAALHEPGMTALDAGCGTGRHAAELLSVGYEVIGTDATEPMLAIARDKLPNAEFRHGSFEALPLEDDSIDLITSGLAVCHATDLDVVFAEFARVLKPGGHVLISDPHPTAGLLGGQAFFQGEGFDLPYIRNQAHPLSTYVAAMTAHGFVIDSLTELPFPEAAVVSNPSYEFYPDVTRSSMLGIPFVVVWEATLSSDGSRRG